MIPNRILNEINNISENDISEIFEINEGYSILFLHKYNRQMKPNLENSWNLIYNLSKLNKQEKLFSKHIEELKKSTFIKRF